MKVLVTGASGFLGSYVVRELLGRGHTVAILTRTESDLWRLGDVSEKLQRLTFEDDSELSKLICESSPDAIIHSAWKGVAGSERNSPVQLENVTLLTQLMTAARDADVKIFLAFGSQAEYGPANNISDERTPLNPSTLYGEAKRQCFHLGEHLAARFEMRFVWMRVFSLYGAADHPHWLIPAVTLAILSGLSPALTAGEQLWDYLYVSDAAEAAVSALEAPEAHGVFNIGCGEVATIRHIVETVRDLIDPSAPLQFGAVPYRPDQVMHLQADIAKLKKAINWTPKTTLDQGLKKTVEYYRNNINRFT